MSSRLTKADLLAMANSNNADERKRAFKLYQAWIKLNPTLSFQDQLSATERHLLKQIFATKGMKVDPRT